MNPTEFQRWLVDNLPEGTEKYTLRGDGTVKLTFDTGHVVEMEITAGEPVA